MIRCRDRAVRAARVGASLVGVEPGGRAVASVPSVREAGVGVLQRRHGRCEMLAALGGIAA